MNFFKKFEKLKVKYKTNKKRILSITVTAVGIACLLIGSSMAYLLFEASGTTQTISAGTLQLSYTNESEAIILNNAVPQSDEQGLNNNVYSITLTNTSTIKSYYELSLNNNCTVGNSYTVNGSSVTANVCIPNNYLKVAVKTNKDEDYTIKNGGNVILKGYLEAKENISFEMIIWLKEETPNDYQGQTETGTPRNVIYNGNFKIYTRQILEDDNFDLSGANKPILASNMIPVYYDETSDVWKKADKNNKETTVTYKLGDVNGDGVVNTDDSTQILFYLSGKKSVFDTNTKLKEKIADLDGDGVITKNDSDLIMQYNVGNIDVFPAGAPLEEKTGTVINRWYSYESSGEYKGRWANAVTVKEANRQTYLNANPGTIIPMDDITTMWVWIPRFNAVTPSNYNGGTQAKPNAIDVTFVKQNETAIDAFTFGDKQLSGFWYGKFETSHTTLASSTTNNNLGCTNETCSNANGIIIKPNVTSLRYNSVSSFFFASRSMEQAGNSFGFVSTEVDTHMSKNNEWGAVAYLTQSIYGRCENSTTCTEVYINNSSEYYTGRSGGNIGGSTPINGTYTDQTSTTNSNTYGFYTYDDYLLDYNTNTKGNKVKGKGTGASTTGTIYGIYDMSGGANEYVMGVYNKTIGNSGFSSLPDIKYYNNYAGSSYTGHALTKTVGWYSDYASFVNASNPWFRRGGFVNSSIAGVFGFGGFSGNSNYDNSSRLVIFNK